MKPLRRSLLIALAVSSVAPLAGLVRAQNEQVIKVVAKRFDFTPNEIRVKKGVPVVLELTTLDVTMGFNAPDFGVRADILPGKPAIVCFTPDKVGKFTFYCDIFCGTGHESMDGFLIVT